MATITAELTSGTAVHISDGRHAWNADEPADVGGADSGPDPYELLLGSLAACTCITIALYCRRNEWALRSVSISLRHDRVHADDCDDCGESATGFLDRVSSEVAINGDFDEAQKKRLARVAVRCPVHKTLDGGVFFSENVTVG